MFEECEVGSKFDECRVQCLQLNINSDGKNGVSPVTLSSNVPPILEFQMKLVSNGTSNFGQLILNIVSVFGSGSI